MCSSTSPNFTLTARKLPDCDHLVADALRLLRSDPTTICTAPLIVRLVENPAFSFFGKNLGIFPGAVNLEDHDLIHVILKRRFTPRDEIYVIGFTMGSSKKMNCILIRLYWLIARVLYPAGYKPQAKHFSWFIAGVAHGMKFGRSDIALIKANHLLDWSVGRVRREFIDLRYIDMYVGGTTISRG